MAVSPALVAVQHGNVVALPGISADAKAAAIAVTFGPSRQLVTVDLGSSAIGKIGGGTIFIDAKNTLQDVILTFPDTQARTDVPAGGEVYALAITGGKTFTLSCAALAETTVYIQAINKAVAPTGVQSVFGQVTVQVGSAVSLTNTTIPGSPVSRTKTGQAGQADFTLAAGNSSRQFLLFQMPQNSGGWVNFLGGAASVGGTDCIHMAAGEKFLSTGFVPSGAIHVYLDQVGSFTVPCIEG